MNNYANIPSLKQHVTRKEDKDISVLRNVAKLWLTYSQENKLQYEIEWLGIPIIQHPADMILMQELIYKVKPDYIIEIGIAHGGSLIYYASLCELLGHGRVIGIDQDIRRHNREALYKHPLRKHINLIGGDSTSDGTEEVLSGMVPYYSRSIVCLDSCHYKDHVLKELRLYGRFVGLGGYIVVFDTITSMLAERGACDISYQGNGPGEAVSEFLAGNWDYRIDTEYNKLFISANTYLEKMSGNDIIKEYQDLTEVEKEEAIAKYHPPYEGYYYGIKDRHLIYRQLMWQNAIK